MDEILLANFLVFHDAVKDAHYDLWVAEKRLAPEIRKIRTHKAA